MLKKSTILIFACLLFATVMTTHTVVIKAGLITPDRQRSFTASTTSRPDSATVAKAFIPDLQPAVQSALYVWRAPAFNGTPIGLTEARRLADFAVAQGIHTIYYDNFGCGMPAPPGCPDGAEVQDSATLAPIISLLHSRGLKVEALYTDNTRIADVVNYNNSVSPNERFDGIRLNIESFPSGSEPATPNDLDVYTQAVAAAGTLPVYVSISHHWDNGIFYNGQTKAAYQHILDIVAGVDVQTAQDQAGPIATITEDEVCYANSLNKRVEITIETYDVVKNLGLNEFNTFFEEGEAEMKEELVKLVYPAVTCPNPQPTGFAYHFYRQSYGSPVISGWESGRVIVTKQADSSLVQDGAQLTYTIRITNTSYVTLTTVTDILPGHVTPTGVLSWTPIITPVGGIWARQVIVTVVTGYTGSLTNRVQATTEEGIVIGTANVVVCSNKCGTYLPVIVKTLELQ